MSSPPTLRQDLPTAEAPRPEGPRLQLIEPVTPRRFAPADASARRPRLGPIRRDPGIDVDRSDNLDADIVDGDGDGGELESPVERLAREEAARAEAAAAERRRAAEEAQRAAARQAQADRWADEARRAGTRAAGPNDPRPAGPPDVAQARRARLVAESEARAQAEARLSTEAEALAAAQQRLEAATAAAAAARAEADRLAGLERAAQEDVRRQAARTDEVRAEMQALVARQLAAHAPGVGEATAAAAARAPAMAAVPPRLGERLVEAGKLTPWQVEVVLMHQASQARRFGEIAVAMGLVTAADVDEALSERPARVATARPPTAAAALPPPRSAPVAPSVPVPAAPPTATTGPAPAAPAAPVPVDRPTAGPSPSADAARVQAPPGGTGDAVRDTAERLIQSAAAGAARLPLAVVSADVAEGRTWFAVRLAMALAQAGQRTLLIEADMRRPRLGGWYPAAAASTGLTGVLCGWQRLADAVTSPAGTALEGLLHLLPAGEPTVDPIELLRLPALGQLLEKVATHFDQVVIDTPAVAEGPDAGQVAAWAGRALVVGRHGVTRPERRDRLVAALNRNGVEVAGVVMNAA